MESYSFNSLVKEYQNELAQNPKNKISYNAYFKKKEESINNQKIFQEEKIDQAETICKTMYGIDKLTETAQEMQLIQGTDSNEGKFDELKRKKEDISEFANRNSESIDNSKKLLTKYLWIFHYNKIQNMPIELYKMLSSEKCEEVQKANETIKSFVSLYEKHPNQFHIDNLIDNNKIIEAANELLFAFNFNVQFNIKSVDEKKQMQQIIENSINAAAFLMNYNHLFNLANGELKKDPFDIYGIFLVLWKDVINEKIKKVNIQDDQDKIPTFSSEVEIYFKTRFILNTINPKNSKFAQKLIPNISLQNFENELETRFLKIEEEIINSFYFVQDNYFSGSFFNRCQMDITQFENENFESYKFSSIIIIIKIEKFINQVISNSNVDYKQVEEDIQSFLKIGSDSFELDLKEFKTKVVKDVSNILLFYFNKDKKLTPQKMLEVLLQILFTVFVPYYNEAFAFEKDNQDPLASIIFMCEIRQVLPFICSSWSNQLLSDIKKGQSDILTTLRLGINNVFHCNNKIYDYYQNFKNTRIENKENCPFLEHNIIKRIEESLVGIIVQECLDIQDSFPNKNYPESAKKSLLGYDRFIQEFLERNNNEQNVNEMAHWAKQKIDEIKSSFH